MSLIINVLDNLGLTCNQLLQLCPTLCNPKDCSSAGFSAHGILQARRLEWVAMPFSRASLLPKDQTCVSYSLLQWQSSYLTLVPPGKPKVRMSVTQSCPTLCDFLDCSPPGSSDPWNSPGKNIGVGGHSLLQGIFPIQEFNPGLLHFRQIFFVVFLPSEPLLHCNLLLQFSFAL